MSDKRGNGMAIKTILVPLRGDATDGRALAAAGMLAKKFAAHLTALHVEPDPGDLIASMPIDVGGGAYFMEELTKSIQASSDAHRDAAKRAFSEWRTAAGIPETANPGDSPAESARLILAVGAEQAEVRARALVSDLVVLGVGPRDEVEAGLVLEVALLASGRPILALPPKLVTPAPGAPVAIAWNDSAESARALAAALPVIADAKEVLVLHAGSTLDPGRLERVNAYLAWHGITSRREELGEEDSAGVLIADRAAEIGASLLVMGAYTHSRARELVFGGVTRHMLQAAQVPLFLSH
jgi:nucleotide-binding universal stress UspA family protein